MDNFNKFLITYTLIILGISALVLSESPEYSASYAKILFQPNSDKFNHYKAEESNLDSSNKKEEVTENYEYDLMFEQEFHESTTEPESEQINLGKIITNKKNSRRNKLIKTAAEEEKFEDEDDSELTDLNDDETGVYYIIHPNGLFQKVVYKTMNDQQNMQISTQVNYENIEPINEPIYSYDPETFVLQRLILGPSLV